MRGLILTLCLGLLPLNAAEQAFVYLRESQSLAQAQQQLAALQTAMPQTQWHYKRIGEHAQSEAKLQEICAAMRHGVKQLPCLVLVDEQGAYAQLLGLEHEPGDIKGAENLRAAPDRAKNHTINARKAELYALKARITLPGLKDEQLEAAIKECELYLNKEQNELADRQLVALTCHYPLLMLAYSRSYTGAHTPQSEKKLLLAIAALEHARDLDKESRLGKQAHAEREKLRSARIKARQYE